MLSVVCAFGAMTDGRVIMKEYESSREVLEVETIMAKSILTRLPA
jgi:hypothetical protein